MGLPVNQSVYLVGELWTNSRLDLDAIWGDELDQLRDGCIRWDED